MKPALTGRILMTVATLIYGVLPPIVDLTDTHVFHFHWTGHARLHLVWMLATISSTAIVTVYLLWFQAANRLFGIRLAGVLGLCVYGGFFLSALTVSLYGGAIAEEHGPRVPPIMGLDANVVVFSFGLAFLLLGWFLASRKGALPCD